MPNFNTPNSFGFTQGIAMDSFGFVTTNTIPPPPPTPQPRYVVLSISSSSGGGPYDFVEIVNTSNGVISNVDGLDLNTQRGIMVTFGGDFASNLNTVYCEGYFQDSWYYPSDDSINYFQVSCSSTSQVFITSLTPSGSTGWVDGIFVLTMVIFEI